MQKIPNSSLPFKKAQFNKALALSVLFWGFIGCHAPPLDVYYVMPEDVHLSQYQSFAIESITDKDSVKQQNFIAQINLGIVEALSQKGYRLADNPELIIRYALKIKTDKYLKLDPVPFNGLIETKPLIEAVFEAEMLVNVIDIKTGKIVWKAATTRDLRSVNTKKITQARINQRMVELFESFSSR